MVKILYYVHDPMCSWCWAFNATWQSIQVQLPASIEVRYVLGGLAPDSDVAMADDMQKNISANWYRIQQQVPGTPFNHDFWTVCQPRRSTYPACRAVMAAKEQNAQSEQSMILAIQQAYYLKAKNPSNDDVLIECAEQIGLDGEQFAQALNNPSIQQQLLAEIKYARQLGVNSFPSLVLEEAGHTRVLEYDYNDPAIVIEQLS